MNPETHHSPELIRWDVYAAVVAPDVFPTSCPVELPPL